METYIVVALFRDLDKSGLDDYQVFQVEGTDPFNAQDQVMDYLDRMNYGEDEILELEEGEVVPVFQERSVELMLAEDKGYRWEVSRGCQVKDLQTIKG